MVLRTIKFGFQVNIYFLPHKCPKNKQTNKETKYQSKPLLESNSQNYYKFLKNFPEAFFSPWHNWIDDFFQHNIFDILTKPSRNLLKLWVDKKSIDVMVSNLKIISNLKQMKS